MNFYKLNTHVLTPTSKKENMKSTPKTHLLFPSIGFAFSFVCLLVYTCKYIYNLNHEICALFLASFPQNKLTTVMVFYCVKISTLLLMGI